MQQFMLPKLLYIGDVPIESSYHGSTLLYRLLEDYPPEKLLVVEGNVHRSQPERRLPDVRYRSLKVGRERLLRTRFHKFYSGILTRSAPTRVRRVKKLRGGFRPEAVLTVSHGYSWITAARFATKHQLPLHLICHDDWPRVVNLFVNAKSRLDNVFGSVYRQAASRLCISPFMRDAYRKRYGVDGDVLLPVNAPEDYASSLGVPRGTSINAKASHPTQIHWFVENRAQLEKELNGVLRLLKAGMILWIFYPKGTSKIQTDLTRDKGWDALLKVPNLQWLSLISFNETWSAFASRSGKGRASVRIG